MTLIHIIKDHFETIFSALLAICYFSMEYYFNFKIRNVDDEEEI
jgi:hypothetical protein